GRLVPCGAWLTRRHEFFRGRGREMPETNKIQAMIPRGATIIENTAGTAAGIDVDLGTIALKLQESDPKVSNEYMERLFGEKEMEWRRQLELLARSTREDLQARRARLGSKRPSTRVFVLPGVPKEMKIMFQRSVLPRIREKSGGAVILSRALHTFGLGESWVAEKLG